MKLIGEKNISSSNIHQKTERQRKLFLAWLAGTTPMFLQTDRGPYVISSF